MADLQQYKKIAVIVSALAAVLLLGGCGREGGETVDGGRGGESVATDIPKAPFAARISVQGDVGNPYLFTGYDGFAAETITDEGIAYTAVALADVIQAAEPSVESYTVLLLGRDGLLSEIGGEDLTGCYLAYTDELGWQHIAENHPISSRIKLLDKIIVAAREAETEGANFAGHSISSSFTAGSIYRNGYTVSTRLNGTSQIHGRTVSVYTSELSLPVRELMDFDKTVAVFTRAGDTVYDRPSESGRVAVGTNRIDYLKSTGERVENIAGILADPPLISITEAYGDVLSAAGRGERTMVIEIDGWGRSIADYAREQGASPYLSSLESATALSVYPFVSTAGLAALLTGENGSVNGIYARQHKQLQCRDIFAELEAQGKTCSYIESSISLIQTSLAPELSPETEEPDRNVFDNTVKAIRSGSDFVYTHFHSVDDFATTYGPFAGETMVQLGAVDRMVKQLVDEFPGTVIITADHGLHETKDGGIHGIVSMDDSLVPYILLKEGSYE